MQSRDAGLSPRRRAALRESPHKSKSAPPSSGGLGVVGLAAAAVAAIAAVGVGYLMKNNHKAKPKRNEKPAVKRKLKTRRGTSSAGSSLRSSPAGSTITSPAKSTPAEKKGTPTSNRPFLPPRRPTPTRLTSISPAVGASATKPLPSPPVETRPTLAEVTPAAPPPSAPPTREVITQEFKEIDSLAASVAANAVNNAMTAVAAESDETEHSHPATKMEAVEDLQEQQRYPVSPTGEVDLEPAAEVEESPTGAPKSEPDVEAELEVAESEEPVINVLEDEPEDEVEHLQDLPVAAMNIAPMNVQDGEAPPPLTDLEGKLRDMALHAYKLINEKKNYIQATKEQQQALDMAINPQNKPGDVRSELVISLAFAMADIYLLQKKYDEVKSSLAIVVAASKDMKEQGPYIRALCNFAFVMKETGKPRSCRDAYQKAYEIAKESFGVNHGQTERVKYEYTAFLSQSGHKETSLTMLADSADALLHEALTLKAQLPEGEAENHAEEAQEEEKPLPPHKQASTFAINSYTNAAAVADSMGSSRHERAHELLSKALDVSTELYGENSVSRMNVLYCLAQHYKKRGMLQESANLHETVIDLMDKNFEVYDPEMLQNRITILRDCAQILSRLGQHELAVDYGDGALNNAIQLMHVTNISPAQAANYLEQFYILASVLHAKVGDEEGAKEMRRSALKGRVIAANPNSQKSGVRTGGRGKKATTNAATQRAGGRRV